jgi:hypothetical protein
MNINTEFERQITNLAKLNYPKMLNLSKKEFFDKMLKLKEKVTSDNLIDINIENGTLPFVIVINSNRITSEEAMDLVNKEGKKGIAKLFPHTSKNFSPIKEVHIPNCEFYLIVNIDRGKKNINLPPKDALEIINNDNRSPLTINEGIAIVMQFPEYLVRNNCFSLLASRNDKDKRVPAIWISSKNNPNLGWCWDGNPHTWLGSASCEKRIGL